MSTHSNDDPLIRTETISVPHESPHVPQKTNSTLTIHYPSQSSYPFSDLTIAILLPGALVLPREYSHFSKILAQSNMLVVIPELNARLIGITSTRDHIKKTIDAGCNCHPNGNYVSVQSIKTVYNWLNPSNSSISMTTPREILLVGHSWGAVAAAFAGLKVCDDPQGIEPHTLKKFGDGFSSDSIPSWKLSAVVMFEGGLGGVTRKMSLPENLVFTHVYSPFYESEAAKLRRALGGSGRFIDVAMDSGTNHFLPNDFAPETNHARTVCAIPRTGGQASFRSTLEIQSQVVQTMAEITLGVWKGRRKLILSTDNSSSSDNQFGGKSSHSEALMEMGLSKLFKVQSVQAI